MAMTGLENGTAIFDVDESFSQRVYLKHLRWVSPAASAGDLCIVRETRTGKVIWKSVADGANFLDPFPFYRWVDGLDVTIPNGELFAYLG